MVALSEVAVDIVASGDEARFWVVGQFEILFL